MSKTAAAPDKAVKVKAKPNPPRLVKLGCAALVLSGICAVGASASLHWLKTWLFISGKKHNPKPGKKNHQTIAELHDQVSKTATSQIVASIVVLIALTLVAVAAYRGRYWARWGTIGLWILATFTGTIAGVGSVLLIAQSEPNAFKIPAFFAGAFLMIAVLCVSLRPSTQYFARNKPVRAAGAPQRRGMFAPRDPAQARPAGGRFGAARSAPARSEATTRPAAPASSKPDRSRSKQRANADAVARGAELARSRARASKSRRTVE
jgi:hypothetical protein